MKLANLSVCDVLLILIIVSLTACMAHTPAINDPDKLVQDCTTLDAATTDGQITADEWPGSVQSLKPVTVERNGDAIIIFTYQVVGSGANGYIVDAKGKPSIDRLTLTAKYPGVYSFVFNP